MPFSTNTLLLCNSQIHKYAEFFYTIRSLFLIRLTDIEIVGYIFPQSLFIGGTIPDIEEVLCVLYTLK